MRPHGLCTRIRPCVQAFSEHSCPPPCKSSPTAPVPRRCTYPRTPVPDGSRASKRSLRHAMDGWGTTTMPGASLQPWALFPANSRSGGSVYRLCRSETTRNRGSRRSILLNRVSEKGIILMQQGTYTPQRADLPLVLAISSGFQHSLAMLAGLITPPIIFASALNLDSATSAYMISASLIGCGASGSLITGTTIDQPLGAQAS